MKIEILETLITSYLKHSEGCRIVQTNWKPSNSWTITSDDQVLAKALFEKIKRESAFKNIFGNNSFEQLIKQAEIDILGINPVENSIFGFDSAFHSNGLNYAASKDNSLKVFKKIFRTILVMQSYFNEYDKFNSLFVTPKVNPSYEKPIKELLEKANNLIGDETIHIDFISNEAFYDKIFDPVKYSINTENDTSELFSRSLKLLNLDPRVNNSFNTNYSEINNCDFHENEMKIGQHVRSEMRKLFHENTISKDEIIKLQDKKYSKQIFNQNFEILRSLDKDIFDNSGRNRYYSKERFFGRYYLTSQWFEHHREKFDAWLNKIK